MTNHVIPEAAVEAAANKIYASEGYWGPLAEAPWYRRKRFLKRARTILEAAGPALQAQAWDEGAASGYELALLEGPNSDYVAKPNPYSDTQESSQSDTGS